MKENFLLKESTQACNEVQIHDRYPPIMIQIHLITVPFNLLSNYSETSCVRGLQHLQSNTRAIQ